MATTKVTTDVIDMSGNTGGLVWAKGATGDQPAVVDSTAGDMRENTTTGKTEVFNGTAWRNLKEAPAPPVTVDYLVVAGGGSGGGIYGGGGGAGGLRTSFSTSGGGQSAESALQINLGTSYPITIGPGGAAVSTYTTANPGTDSTFSSITATGGGGGGHYTGPNAGNGNTGGSGSGGSIGANVGGAPSGGAAVTSPVIQGYAGGGGYHGNSAAYTCGGGGGAGAVGQTQTQGSFTGGNGGAGLSVSITGSAVTYAGGGGGLGQTTAGTGGSGGGGTAGSGAGSNAGSAGTANTGGGGGGSNVTSGAGGSGIIILRYPATQSATLSGGATGSVDQPITGSTDKYAEITGSGTITFS